MKYRDCTAVSKVDGSRSLVYNVPWTMMFTAVWKSTSASGAPDNSSLSHFAAMTRPSWLCRAVRNRYHHAIERTRRKILISTQVHKLVAFVACSDDFENQPGVVNGCSDLLFEVLGDRGVHARSAVGTNALPLGVPVEIEAVVEVEAGS